LVEENITSDIPLRICEDLDCDLTDIVELVRNWPKKKSSSHPENWVAGGF
jgi:DNA-binding Xre family transcriptional regulator